MSDQTARTETNSSNKERTADRVSEAARRAFEQASGMAQDAGAKAKQAASETAATMTSQVKDMLDQQIGSGAGMARHFAGSMRGAADDLDRQSPLVAGFVRTFADRVDHYAGDLQHQTAEQLTRAAADFTRKQPALVFGLAAFTGFLMFRTFKNTGTVSSPSIQPAEDADAAKQG
ncbi:hypothetical protein [Rhodoplanes sp. Z2-YC6860]|uniref:hypothetical protein n=1 Tax=Rhodoplanes sp. Z2-YC6860 TaxID=674703 RepID=UPI00078C9295|nr:hypothetical protein [Rhodoplanes sp. Z2-YC6860]AMN41580.1 hypothetical protein RHPLAN_31450 [Rhodoplanes sp. Z2-YC6860]